MINCGPSPSKYLLPPVVGYQNHDVRLERKPAYTFGVRTSNREIDVGPGPAKYFLTDVSRYGKSMQIAHHFGKRYRQKEISETPAPNTYSSPDFRKYPAFSFGIRWKSEIDLNQNPSPAHYQLPSSIGGDDVTLIRAPKYSIVGNRPNLVSQSFGPGPATYFPSPSNVNKILPTIKSRIEHKISSDTPAPNAYSLPKTRHYPAFSFASRLNDKVDLNGNHSATHYQLPSSIGGGDFIFKRAPIYSIRNRCPIPSMKSFGPGPAAYLPNLECCKKLLPTLKFRTVPEKSSDTPPPNQYFLQNYKPGIRDPSYTIARRTCVLAESIEC